MSPREDELLVSVATLLLGFGVLMLALGLLAVVAEWIQRFQQSATWKRLREEQHKPPLVDGESTASRIRHLEW